LSVSDEDHLENRNVKHYKICLDHNQKLYIGCAKFQSMARLVEHYTSKLFKYRKV